MAQTAKALGRRTVFIASGDLSHRLKADGPYGFAPEGPQFDQTLTQALGQGDFKVIQNLDARLCDAAEECGLRAIWMMAGFLDGTKHQSTVLSYEGPFGVGFGVAAFEVETPDAKKREPTVETAGFPRAPCASNTDPYVALPDTVWRLILKQAKQHPSPGTSAEMTRRKAGVFVTLKQHGRLRGCIGTIHPVSENVALEILRNAISSGVEDPRFAPVTQEELTTLTYSVDVMGDPEPIDTPDKLNVKRYGDIVTRGGRRGLLLPILEGIDTVEEQIAIAKQKAGIPLRETCRLERFEVVRHT
jgi:AmmeMemoRadiSam system protein A